MELEAQFKEAMEKVMSLGKRPSNDVMLQLYSLKKQAEVGDVNIKKPGMFDMVGQAKYKAWSKLKGTDKADAMQKYIDLVNKLAG